MSLFLASKSVKSSGMGPLLVPRGGGVGDGDVGSGSEGVVSSLKEEGVCVAVGGAMERAGLSIRRS